MATAEPNRLFFALWPDAAVREACAQAARELKLKDQPGGRLVDPERYHLTQLFLGDFISAPQEEALLAMAQTVRQAPFQLTLDHASSFARDRHVPWWLGPRDPHAAASALHVALRDGAHRAGVTPDRTRFAPHVTIVRDAGRVLPGSAIKPIHWNVSEFTLVRSLLDSQPPEYRVIGRWPLVPGVAAPPAAQMKLF